MSQAHSNASKTYSLTQADLFESCSEERLLNLKAQQMPHSTAAINIMSELEFLGWGSA